MQSRRLDESIKVLREQAKLAPYTFPPGSEQWLTVLNRTLKEDLGTLAILGPAGLNIRQTPCLNHVQPDALALSISAWVNSFRGKGKRIALGLPPGARHFPLLLAADCVLADALERALVSARSQIPHSLSGVLVVSTDLDIRSRYCDLFVRSEALDRAYPGSRMRPTGEQVKLMSYLGADITRGVCFCLPGRVLPTTGLKPALAILDFRYGRLARRTRDIAAWACGLHQNTAVVAVYTLGDPDTASILKDMQFMDLPIDHSALSECASLMPVVGLDSSIDWNLIERPTYLNRDHEIITTCEATIEAAFWAARKTLDAQGAVDVPCINRARWIMAALTHLPVPLVWYEQSARNLGRSTLRRLTERLSAHYEAGTGPTMQALKMHFEQILQQLQDHNPRAERLLTLIPSLVEESDELLILVRDRVFQRALQGWIDLEAFPAASWARNVEIRPYADYSLIAGRNRPVTLVIGAFPRRYRWIAGSALGYAVKFLAYPMEVDAVTRQLEAIYGDSAIQENARRRDHTLCNRASVTSAANHAIRRTIPKLALSKPKTTPFEHAKPPVDPPTKVKELQNLAGALEAAKTRADRILKVEAERRSSWEDDETEEPQEEELTDVIEGVGHADDVQCVRVEVEYPKRGRGVLWLGAQQTVECVPKSQPEQISQVAASSLVSGDLLIIIEEDIRGSLFDRVVQLAEDQPELQYLARFRKQWQDTMRLVAAKYSCERHGYWELHRALREAGSTITTEMSVRNWILGRVIGPDHVSSIVAVGKVAGVEALERNSSGFDKAFRAIRSIHQAIGMRLTRAIRTTSRYLLDEGGASSPDDLADYIWLPVEELLDSVEMAEVLDVSQKTKGIPAQYVGRFLAGGRN